MCLATMIRDQLQAAFAPDHLEIVNESHKHKGHAGDDGSGQSHWRIVIRAQSLAAQSRVGRHRAVHSALGPDILNRIHALTIEAS